MSTSIVKDFCTATSGSAGCEWPLKPTDSFPSIFRGAIPGLYPIESCFPQLSSGVSNISSFSLPAAFAEQFEFEVMQRDQQWRQHFVRGFAANPPDFLAGRSENFVRLRLLPDRRIFSETTRIAFHVACGRFQVQAIFHPGICFELHDLSAGDRREYRYTARLRDYIEEVEHDLIGRIAWMSTFHMILEEDGESAEAVIFDRSDGPRLVQSFVNGERWMEEGSHITGLERGFVEVSRLVEPRREPSLPSPSDPLHGYTVLLAMKLDDTQSTGLLQAGPARRC